MRDTIVVIAIVALAAGFVVWRLWRATRRRTPGCGAGRGCCGCPGRALRDRDRHA